MGEEEALPKLLIGTSNRPIIRHAGAERAMEIDLNVEEPPRPSSRKGALVADLTDNGTSIYIMQRRARRFGEPQFRHGPAADAAVSRSRARGVEKGIFCWNCASSPMLGWWAIRTPASPLCLAQLRRPIRRLRPYPFTTLTPQVGIVEYPDYLRLTVCDVPGLIEGAHQNVGLGHEFLRHIERCKLLVILLDMAGTDGRDPADDYKQLIEELGLYDHALLERPRMVVANKMDEPNAEANLKKFKRKIRKTPILPISAAFGEGMEEFRKVIREQVK